MTRDEVKKELIIKIGVLQGAKSGILISELDCEILKNSEDLILIIEELVQEKEIVEVEYCLPNSQRLKSFYLPKGTEIKLRGGYQNLE